MAADGEALPDHCGGAEAESVKLKGEMMEWQPIETAPRDGTGIFAFWPATFGLVHPGCYGVTCFEGGHWCNTEDDDDWYQEPAHWMPLPAPPETTSAKT